MKMWTVVLRIVYTIGIVGAILFLPWYMVLAASLVGMFLFPKYFEGIIMVLVMDGLYSVAGSVPHAGFYTIIAILIYIILLHVKKHLTWYS